MKAATKYEGKVIYIHILDAEGLRDFNPKMTAEEAAEEADEILCDATNCNDTEEADGYYAGGWEDIIVCVHSTMADFDKETSKESMGVLSYFAEELSPYGYSEDNPRVRHFDDGRDL